MKICPTKYKIINFFKQVRCKHCAKIKNTAFGNYCNNCQQPQWEMTGAELENYWNKDKIK